MNYFSYIILFISLSTPLLSFGQLDNTVFYTQDSLSGNKNDLYFNFSSTGFHKNDEYYSSFADGQTFFGYQFNPELEFYFTENISFTGGLLLQKDFGNNKFTTFQPTYKIKMRHKRNTFLFGNIRPHLNHKYIEPMMDFNRFAYEPLENGMQYLIGNKKFKADIWIDWGKMIYANSPFLEEISGGMTIEQTLLDKKRFSIKGKWQWLLYHEGGQLDTTDMDISLISNGALGLTFNYKLNSKMIDEITFDNYFTYYDKHFGIPKFQLRNGNGIYLNASVKKKHHTLMVSYWQGNQYFSMHGTPIYLSQSRSFKDEGYIEKDRKLLFFRLISNYKLSEDVNFSMRLEPFYDFNRSWKDTWSNGIIDFSSGFYIQLEKSFLVKNIKDKRVE